MKRTTARTRKQMKLVVTGALGHIGSRLLQSFQPDQLQEVVIVDHGHLHSPFIGISQHQTVTRVSPPFDYGLEICQMIWELEDWLQ